MSPSILIGTRGWNDPTWTARFYPEELPNDWRFCYYSNRLRSVIVPADAWDAAQPTEWIEDSDPAFRFVLELPAALCQPATASDRLKEFLARVAPLAPQIAGWLLRPAADATPDAAWLDRTLARLAHAAPVCLDATGAWSGAAIERVCATHAAGRCWRPAIEPGPAPEGALLVCLSEGGTPRTQRRLLEEMRRWQAESRPAGLYFEGPQAAQQAEQARLLADLIGV